MKELRFSNGLIILVDKLDYELVSKYGWYCRKNHNTFYAHTKGLFNGKRRWFYMHQLILNTIGTKYKVDHKDGNGLNNKRDNLRIACHSDNIKNSRKLKGTSKYFGVSLHMGKYWLAKININGKQKHLGIFKVEQDAAKAYNKAAIETGNEFYRINIL